MFKTIREIYRPPTAIEMIDRELTQAFREKLAAETARDYADSIVKYNDKRIKRLKDHATKTIADQVHRQL